MTPLEGRRIDRRTFLRLGGRSALALAAAGAAGTQLFRGAGLAEAKPPAKSNDIRLVATDGFFSFPGRRIASEEGGVYGFGFAPVQPDETYASVSSLIQKYKGKVTWPAPTLAVDKDTDTFIVLTNLGFVVRPDLDDSHTIHWHGFRNPNAVFDGVPEVSIAVPLARNFPYFYRARYEGTYMYHCHFEDTEHVQMGMDGIVYVKAARSGYAYDLPNGKGVPETRFDRQFTMLLNEIYTPAHDNLRDVQENVWSDYTADTWLINGRTYPDTVVRDQELAGYLGGELVHQPVSSLVQLNAGERGLIRIASLGYEQHNMMLESIPMHVVGQDATDLGTNAYTTNSLYLGAGEARDVIIEAPPYDPGRAIEEMNAATDQPTGRFYNRYWFRNHSAQRLINGDGDPVGGMATEVRVYDGTLPGQDHVNQTV